MAFRVSLCDSFISLNRFAASRLNRGLFELVWVVVADDGESWSSGNSSIKICSGLFNIDCDAALVVCGDVDSGLFNAQEICTLVKHQLEIICGVIIIL
jgi:hypothetical protein